MPDLPDELSFRGHLQPVLDRALVHALDLAQTELGNLQLFDWTTRSLAIRAQRGFDEDFLAFFARVSPGEGTACARALSSGEPVVIEDVMTDAEFAPFRGMAERSGFRSVQSTPMIASSGMPLGVLSTHFPTRRRLSVAQTNVLQVAARVAANAIQRQQVLDQQQPDPARDTERIIADTHAALMTSAALLRATEKALARSEQSVHDLRETIQRSRDRLRRLGRNGGER